MKRRLPNSATIVRAVVTGVLAGVWLAGCGKETGESGPAGPDARGQAPPPVVEVATIERTTLARELALTGEVVVRRRALISPMVEGVIEEFPLAEGDFVAEAGEVLAVIDRPLYRAERDAAAAAAEVAEAFLTDLEAGSREEEIAEAAATVGKLEAAEKLATADLGRVRRLVEAEALSVEELERAEAAQLQAGAELEAARQRLKQREAGPTPTALAVARAQVAEARARLRLAEEKVAEGTVRAPFPGVIGETFVSAGDIAAPRAPLLEMHDPASAVVRFSVPEWAAGAVETGQQARVRFDAAPGETVDARVVRVFPQLDRTTRTRTVEVMIGSEQRSEMAEGKPQLLPGMFARLWLTVELADDALVVPSEALVSRPGEGHSVMGVRDGKLQRVPVTIGIEGPARTQVFGELEPGEQVAVFGHEALRPGTEVRTRARDAPAVKLESSCWREGRTRFLREALWSAVRPRTAFAGASILPDANLFSEGGTFAASEKLRGDAEHSKEAAPRKGSAHSISFAGRARDAPPVDLTGGRASQGGER